MIRGYGLGVMGDGLSVTGEQPWTEGDLIKSPSGREFSTYSQQAGMFVGMIDNWDCLQMYMFFTGEGNTLRLSGNRLAEANKRINLRGDGQWSAFPCLFEQTTEINEALADYFMSATPGDIIKARNRFAFFSADKRWCGDLTALRPGEGYLFRRMGAGAVTVNCYDKSTDGAPQRQRAAGNGQQAAFSNPNAATNMTMIAKITNYELRNTNY